jgi:hypothetical protein
LKGIYFVLKHRNCIISSPISAQFNLWILTRFKNSNIIQTLNLFRPVLLSFPLTHATTMTSMEDLISNISGNMHVSTDGYDLKALQVSLYPSISSQILPVGKHYFTRLTTMLSFIGVFITYNRFTTHIISFNPISPSSNFKVNFHCTEIRFFPIPLPTQQPIWSIRICRRIVVHIHNTPSTTTTTTTNLSPGIDETFKFIWIWGNDQ